MVLRYHTQLSFSIQSRAFGQVEPKPENVTPAQLCTQVIFRSTHFLRFSAYKRFVDRVIFINEDVPRATHHFLIFRVLHRLCRHCAAGETERRQSNPEWPVFNRSFWHGKKKNDLCRK